MSDSISVPRVGAIPEEFWEEIADTYPARTDGFHLKDIVLWHHLLALWKKDEGPRLAQMDLTRLADAMWLGTKEIVACLERLREGGLLVPVRAAVSHRGGNPVDSELLMPVVPSWYLDEGWRGDGTIEGKDSLV